jgi:hypothetical protein
VNLPASFLTALLVLLWTPKDPPQTFSVASVFKEVDVVGLALFAATLFSLMMCLMNLAAPMWWVWVITAALAISLVVYSRQREEPFFDVRMLADNTPLVVTYLRACTLATITYGALYGFCNERACGSRSPNGEARRAPTARSRPRHGAKTA